MTNPKFEEPLFKNVPLTDLTTEQAKAKFIQALHGGEKRAAERGHPQPAALHLESLKERIQTLFDLAMAAGMDVELTILTALDLSVIADEWVKVSASEHN